MTLDDWFARWNIPPQALDELRKILTQPAETQAGELPDGTSEARAQQEIRLAASQRKGWLLRNNMGAVTTDDGRHVRFGLANESARMNKEIKSADLIGLTPVKITDGHVGQTMGVFTSVEVKRPGWSYKNSDRERAQLRWNQAVLGFGGFAGFATGPHDFINIIDRLDNSE